MEAQELDFLGTTASSISPLELLAFALSSVESQCCKTLMLKWIRPPQLILYEQPDIQKNIFANPILQPFMNTRLCRE